MKISVPCKHSIHREAAQAAGKKNGQECRDLGSRIQDVTQFGMRAVTHNRDLGIKKLGQQKRNLKHFGRKDRS